MNDQSRLAQRPEPSGDLNRLKEELAAAHDGLRQDEARLAEEQAAVNAFRMHCRLQLGPWVEEIHALRTTRQQLLTRLALLQQVQQARDRGESPPLDEYEWLHGENNWADDPVNHFDDGEESAQPTKDRLAEKRLYRQLARRFHPDLAENSLQIEYATSMMAAINAAYAAQDLAALRDLAGELDPETAAELQANAHLGATYRRLRRQLQKCRGRRRKVAQQRQQLHQDGTARLWQKAQQIENQGNNNWWDEVAAALRREIEEHAAEIDTLRSQIEALKKSF